MDASKILGADILDILFDGRNKEYGAYDLRMTYPKRLLTAVGGMVAVILLLLLGYFLSGMHKGKALQAPTVNDVELVQVEKEKPVETPPPPQVKTPPPQVTTRIFTNPLLTKEDIKPEEKPPEQQTLTDVKIGDVNRDGQADIGITGPPSEGAANGIVEKPKKQEEDYEKTFIKVEQESTYPGGIEAWKRYLNKNFRYPEQAQNMEIQGVVEVQFIVDKDGNVSEVQAISGPEQGGLREEAIRVIKKSGKWAPAIQNGRQVKSYKRQPITFQIENQ